MTNLTMSSLVLLMALGLFLQRPAALGQDYTSLGLIIVLLLTGSYLIGNFGKLNRFSGYGRDFLIIIVLITCYLIYESMLVLALGSSDVDSWTKELVITAVVTGCYSVFLVKPEVNQVFFRYFILIISLLGWSSFITLALAYQFGLDALELFRIRITDYADAGSSLNAGTVYFPFSMAYSSLLDADIFSLYRFSGFFREAGIYQAVAAYCLVLAKLQYRSMWLRLGLILGIVCTFSTIGLAMMMLAIGVGFYFTNRLTVAKFLTTILIVVIGLMAAIYAPVVGLEAKREAPGFSDSVGEREYAVLRGLERAGENPAGDGPFSGKYRNADITLISAIGGIGFIGFLLQLLLLSGFRGRFASVDLYRMGACMPLLITALLSQPIAASPIMYVLIMVMPVRRAMEEGKHRYARRFSVMNRNQLPSTKPW